MSNIGSYSCSCFSNLEELYVCVRFPKKGRAIAKGTMFDKYGTRSKEQSSTHIHWFLFDNANPACEFEVIEIWEKNG